MTKCMKDGEEYYKPEEFLNCKKCILLWFFFLQDFCFFRHPQWLRSYYGNRRYSNTASNRDAGSLAKVLPLMAVDESVHVLSLSLC